eukprot:77497-Amphidinium_carterae.2
MDPIPAIRCFAKWASDIRKSSILVNVGPIMDSRLYRAATDDFLNTVDVAYGTKLWDGPSNNVA